MKKAITIILVFMLMASCSMTIRDPEGWEIYQVGWTLEEGTVLIQSHDGFRWGEYLLNETIKHTPVTIENVLDKTIKVKVTYAQQPAEWIAIAPLSSITIQTLTQSDRK
jgi:hypothetical protein